MSTYATTTGLEIQMIGVTFDTLTSALATQSIDQAESVINNYLSKRYDMSSVYFQTYTSCPPIVRTLTYRLAKAYMWPDMSRGSKESITRGEKIEKSVLADLLSIQEFNADLLDTAGSVILDMSKNSKRVLCNTSTFPTTFNEDVETDWVISQNKLDAIDSGRDSG